MTETALLADIVLPATMFMEHDDLYQAGGHSHIQIGAEADRAAGRMPVEPRGAAGPRRAAGCAASRLRDDRDGDHRRNAACLRLAGREDGAGAALDRHRAAVRRGAFPSRLSAAGQALPFRARLARDRSRLGAHADAARLHAGDRRSDARSSVPHGDRAGAAVPQHQLHRDADVAASGKGGRPCCCIRPMRRALGIADGDRVRLGNARGEVVLHARLFDGLQPGVVVAESVWPNAAFEGGIGINALTSDDPAPPMGGAVFHDTAVWLRAASCARMPLAAEYCKGKQTRMAKRIAFVGAGAIGGYIGANLTALGPRRHADRSMARACRGNARRGHAPLRHDRGRRTAPSASTPCTSPMCRSWRSSSRSTSPSSR